MKGGRRGANSKWLFLKVLSDKWDGHFLPRPASRGAGGDCFFLSLSWSVVRARSPPGLTAGLLLPLACSVTPTPRPTPPAASWRMFLTLICVSQPTCSGLITVRPVLINIQVWRAPRCLCFITAERSVCRVRPPLPAAALTAAMITP